MHIPDGFLDNRICLVTGVVSATALGGALRRLRPDSDPGLAPRMGVTAAYIFAAQMINFPVAAGTSGHLLGGLLAAILLGPAAAAVVMTAVFLIQAFFFVDGGVTALGANVLNMGLAGTMGGYAVYRALAGPEPQSRRCLVAAAVAAWLSVMLGAAFTSAELALSGAVPSRLVFPAMLGVHALIGLGEAAITVGALGLLWRVRPDLMAGRSELARRGRRWAWAALAGLVFVAVLAPFASKSPDGLDHVSERLHFSERAHALPFHGPFPEYRLPGLGDAAWAPILVSLLGSGIMIAALMSVAAVQRRAKVELRAGRSLPHLDARVALGGVLALVLSAVLLPLPAAPRLWLLLLFAAAWTFCARVSLRWLGGRALLLVPFIALAALSSPWRQGSGPGMGFYCLAFLRAGISLLAMAALIRSVPEPEILAGMAAFRLPRMLAETIAFTLRYLRVLSEEAGRMLQARSARSAGGGTLALRASVAGGMVGSLFVRSYERGERVSQAMAARGFTGGPTVVTARLLTPLDLCFAAGCALLVLGVWLWA